MLAAFEFHPEMAEHFRQIRRIDGRVGVAEPVDELESPWKFQVIQCVRRVRYVVNPAGLEQEDGVVKLPEIQSDRLTIGYNPQLSKVIQEKED